jgi:hypothetical protein
MSAKCPT